MEQRVLIKRVLEQKFSVSDLESLCFELNLDYESLSGSDKSGKALAIVEHFIRRSKLDKLSRALRKLRPEVFISADLEKLVNENNVAGIKELLSANRDVLATALGNYRLPFNSFSFGGSNQFSADFLLLAEETALRVGFVLLRDPKPVSSQLTELKDALSLITEWEAWVRENSGDALKQIIARFTQEEGRVSASSLGRYQMVGSMASLAPRYIIIAGRRTSNSADQEVITGLLRDAHSKQIHSSQGRIAGLLDDFTIIEVVSHDRLIDAAQNYVRDLEGE